MHRQRLLPSILAALTLLGCVTRQEEPPPQTLDVAALRDTITAIERQWSAAFVAGDAAAIANLYTEDGAQVEPAGEWRRGRAGITSGLKAQLDTLNVTTREDIPEELIAAGDYLMEFGRFAFTATTKKGNKPVSGAGRYMVLWRKDADGQWRIHRDIGNEAPNTAGSKPAPGA